MSSSIRRILRLVGLAIGLLLSTNSITAAQKPASVFEEIQRLEAIAKVAQKEARFEDAIHAYETIAVVAAGAPKAGAIAYLNIGNIYMKTGKYDEATAAFRRSISLDSSAEAYNDLGEALGMLKQYQPALEAFQQAIALDGQFLKARYNMGVTFDFMGQLKYAEFVFRILIRDHPGFALAYDSLAVILSRTARAAEAIPLHQKAISLDPSEAFYYYNLAVSYLMLGETQKAQEIQQKLRSLDPNIAERLAHVIAKRKK